VKNVLEVAFAERLRAQAIGQGARGLCGRPLNERARVERFLGVAGKLRLASPDLWSMTARCELDAAGDTREQASTRDRREYEAHVRKLFENLQPARRLPGDDSLVVIGRHHRIAMQRFKLFSLLLALQAAGANSDDLRAECNGSFALQSRRVGGHYDDRLRSPCSRRIRNSLCVIARRIGDHAALQLLCWKLRDLVICAAQFEAANRLSGFVF